MPSAESNQCAYLPGLALLNHLQTQAGFYLVIYLGEKKIDSSMIYGRVKANVKPMLRLFIS